MDKKHLITGLLIIVIFVAAISVVALNLNQNSSPSDLPRFYNYKIINVYPRSTTAYTQGLVFDDDGFLFESVGGWGSSYLRKIDLETGDILKEHKLSDEYFAEGLVIVNNTLIQLTWLSERGFVYDKETFDLLRTFDYQTQGWGLTFDGERLIMSDGSSTLFFLDPLTYDKIGEITVKDGDAPVTELNELEYINNKIYANIWKEDKIAIIDPHTGTVKGWIDLTGLYGPRGYDDVLNGIAYDEQTNRLFITRKIWLYLYHVEITPAE